MRAYLGLGSFTVCFGFGPFWSSGEPESGVIYLASIHTVHRGKYLAVACILGPLLLIVGHTLAVLPIDMIDPRVFLPSAPKSTELKA